MRDDTENFSDNRSPWIFKIFGFKPLVALKYRFLIK